MPTLTDLLPQAVAVRKEMAAGADELLGYLGRVKRKDWRNNATTNHIQRVIREYVPLLRSIRETTPDLDTRCLALRDSLDRGWEYCDDHPEYDDQFIDQLTEYCVLMDARDLDYINHTIRRYRDWEEA